LRAPEHARRQDQQDNPMIRRTFLAGALLATCVTLAACAAEGYDQAGHSKATATFAGGCFWCVEEAFDAVDGVLSTTSGYTGGQRRNPTYEQVSSGETGHVEAVRVVFDPSKVSYEKLLEVFWRNVDAVDAGGQFCDRGSQYRAAVFYHSNEQRQQAEASKADIAARLGQAVVTDIVAAGPFYQADEYHQDYYKRNPLRYKFYKWNCGRAQRLEALWGKESAR
jgi:peptide-methionine (S)-S-oxide reductase